MDVIGFPGTCARELLFFFAEVRSQTFFKRELSLQIAVLTAFTDSKILLTGGDKVVNCSVTAGRRGGVRDGLWTTFEAAGHERFDLIGTVVVRRIGRIVVSAVLTHTTAKSRRHGMCEHRDMNEHKCRGGR
jgi:hypothetical protein